MYVASRVMSLFLCFMFYRCAGGPNVYEKQRYLSIYTRLSMTGSFVRLLRACIVFKFSLVLFTWTDVVCGVWWCRQA